MESESVGRSDVACVYLVIPVAVLLCLLYESHCEVMLVEGLVPSDGVVESPVKRL